MKFNPKEHIAGFAIAAAILVVLAVVYIFGCVFFGSRFLPNTVVGGVDVSYSTAAEAASTLEQNTGSYTLTVTDLNENTYDLNASDIDFSYTDDYTAADVLSEQNALTWPVSFFSSRDIGLVVTYDPDAVKNELSGLLNTGTEPVNAYLDLSGDAPVIVDAVYGVNEAKVLDEVDSALQNQEPSLSLSMNAFYAPEIASDNETLVAAKEKAENYAAATITYDIEGQDEALTSSEILSLLTVSENNEVTINEDAVASYVADMASRLNTYGDVREIQTTAGGTVNIGGGDYGWVVSKSKEAAQIIEDLEGGTPVEREPVWEQTAIGPIGDDIGNTYLEIDYTNQTVYYIKDGSAVWSSPIVSGNISLGNGSPDGIFKLIFKESPATLVGEDYESDVTYFCVFAYNVGFHDASWRDEFGGDIYKTKGSHGCINLPYESAQYIYENVPNGTPVVAYYREDVSLTTTNAQYSNAFSAVR